MKSIFSKLLITLFCLTWLSTTNASIGIGILTGRKKYQNSENHTPVQIDAAKLVQSDSVKNIILFIGDGMGVAQVFAGLTANHGKLNLEYLKHIGFSKTQSGNSYVTDSAAGATAMASGVKTYNGAIGVNMDTVKVPTILELAEAKGLATGLVSTCGVTHATPAAFIAHQKKRDMYESIARDFLATDVDVVIGGGWSHFVDRMDGEDLLHVLNERGYATVTEQTEIDSVNSSKIFALMDEGHLPRMPERGDFLPNATRIALDVLSQNENGFFLMVEGSQIDWGGHKNNVKYIIDETLDFDRAIGVALEFAVKKGETLIICTADHETGGLSLESGDIAEGKVKADFTTSGHTGIMVPVFSNGPGAENFIGIYENTALFEKMKKLLNL